MKITLISILSFLLSSSVYAAQIDFRLELSFLGESTDSETLLEEMKEQGCQRFDFEEDEDMICVYETVLDESDLPFSLSLGDASFSISTSGVVSLGASVGDADASAYATLQLPTGENSELLALPAPLKLEISGGDHASGWWSVDGTVQLMVTDDIN